jgi:large subunit ribosomal protein L23
MSSIPHEEKLLQVIVGPHVSEKSTTSAERGRVVFKVNVNATKKEIRQAVEKLFEVKVENVQVMSVSGKRTRFGRTVGRRKAWKKAYVRLAEGHDIDFIGAE